jgi:hypothetical protein
MFFSKTATRFPPQFRPTPATLIEPTPEDLLALPTEATVEVTPVVDEVDEADENEVNDALTLTTVAQPAPSVTTVAQPAPSVTTVLFPTRLQSVETTSAFESTSEAATFEPTSRPSKAFGNESRSQCYKTFFLRH